MNIKKITAAFLSAVIAAANTGIIAPTFSAAAETVVAENVDLHNYDCTARISIIDGLTGEYMKDLNARLMSNPYGSSYCVAKWNTSEEAVKTIPNLLAKDDFFIDVQPLSKSKTIYGEEYVTFDHYGQTKNIVLKVFPWKSESNCNICVSVCDWTNFKDNIAFFTSKDLEYEHLVADIYDENGDYFTSYSLNEYENYLSLPDGKYTLKAFNSNKFHLVSANSEKAKYAKELFGIEVPETYEIEFEVKNGKSDKSLELFYEKYDELCPANDVTFRAVDSVTGENIKGINFSIYSPDYDRSKTYEEPENLFENLQQGRYEIKTFYVPPTYMQDFTIEATPEDAISEITYSAGGARFMFEADEPTEVTMKFTPINEQEGNCTANISLVDISTGKNIEGAELILEQNPTASGRIIDHWNTSDKAVNHVDKLFKGVNYGVTIMRGATRYAPLNTRYFSFDNNYEEQDIVLRAVPQGINYNVNIHINDYSDAKLSESGTCFVGEKFYNGNAYINIYDKNGNYFCSAPSAGIDVMYLPDGEYTAQLVTVDEGYNIISRDWALAKKIIECYPDMPIPYKEGVHFKVVDGKPDKYLNFYVTKNENDTVKPAVNGSLKLKVVDGRTFEPVEGVKVRIITNEYNSKLIADWVSSRDGELFVDGLEENWYYIHLDDVPEKYNKQRSVSSFEKNFYIKKDNNKYETQIVLWPNDYEYYSPYLRVHDLTGIGKDNNDRPVKFDKNTGSILALNDYNDIIKKYVEIKGADDGKVYYPRVSTDTAIVLPDGNYTATLLDVEDKYVTLGTSSNKAKLLMETKGYADGSYGFTTNFSIVDGKPVGKTDFYLYKQSAYDKMHMGHCTLNVKAVDVTDKNNVPDMGIIVEYDPERQMDIVDNWNVKDEPEKTIEGLYNMGDYRITAYSESGEYIPVIPEKKINFSDQTYCDLVFSVIPASKVLKGDSNGDGSVDMADVVMIMQALANPNKYQFTELGRYNADMDGNGVTVGDAQKIQRILLGLDK